MIAEIISEVAGMEQKRVPYKVRPSLASPEVPELDYKGRCKRQMVYDAMGFSWDNINDRFILTLDDSFWHEVLTHDWINKTSWKLVDTQIKVDCGYFGEGHIDGILRDMMGKEYLYEHKAINHFTFQRYLGNELPIDYIAQCCIYLSIELKEYDINQALLLIKNKNTAQYLEFLIEYDAKKDEAVIIQKQNSIDKKPQPLNIKISKILQRTKEKFEFVEKKSKAKTLPLRDYDIDNWHCEYCFWKNTCWKDYKEEIEKYTVSEIEVSQEVETALGYYLELNMHLKEMEKEKEKIAQQVKDMLKEKQIKRATTEKYIITLSVSKTSRIDKEKIPPEILEKVTVQSLVERLNIRLKKEVNKNGEQF